MDLKILLVYILDVVYDYEQQNNLEIPTNIFNDLMFTIFGKWDDIQVYYRQGRIDELYIAESFNIILKRILSISNGRNLNEGIIKEAMKIKDCDHYPWCAEPKNR